MDCKDCSNNLYKRMYEEAKNRFDKQIVTLTIITSITIVMMFLCLTMAVGVIIKYENFINSFEYEEITEYTIEQDWRGENQVIIGEINGAESYSEEEKENSSNKNNTIIIGK